MSQHAPARRPLGASFANVPSAGRAQEKEQRAPLNERENTVPRNARPQFAAEYTYDNVSAALLCRCGGKERGALRPRLCGCWERKRRRERERRKALGPGEPDGGLDGDKGTKTLAGRGTHERCLPQTERERKGERLSRWYSAQPQAPDERRRRLIQADKHWASSKHMITPVPHLTALPQSPRAPASICHSPFESPVETPCGHVFCRGCITRWMAQDSRCPISKEPLNSADFRKVSSIILSMLDELAVQCAYCRTTTSRRDIDSHFKNDCTAPQACEARSQRGTLR